MPFYAFLTRCRYYYKFVLFGAPAEEHHHPTCGSRIGTFKLPYPSGAHAIMA